MNIFIIGYRWHRRDLEPNVDTIIKLALICQQSLHASCIIATSQAPQDSTMNKAVRSCLDGALPGT